MQSTISIAAIGDISFEGRNAENPCLDIFSAVATTFEKSNLVVGNLESPLVVRGDPVSGKCTLRGCPEWAEVMREAGIKVLSLANNHIMDFGEAGLFSTIRSIEEAGLAYVGAGRNKKEACAPLFLDVGGKRVAFLARTSVIVSSPSYAGETTGGVAFLDAQETKQNIESCKGRAEIVILLIHWGLEDYSFPSPHQRLLAREFMGAGVDVILGHHPHVIQGLEQIGNGLVVYSLGNFLFDEFEWTFAITELEGKTMLSSLSPGNRKGAIVNLAWESGQRPEVTPVFTRIDEDCRVVIDVSSGRDHELNYLSEKVGHFFYRCWWHTYAIRKEWQLRMKGKMSVKRILGKIWKLRFRHFKESFGTFHKSIKIAAGKSTNPYD